MEEADDEPKPEKLSLRKELKRRRRQGDALADCEKGKEMCGVDEKHVRFASTALPQFASLRMLPFSPVRVMWNPKRFIGTLS